MAAGTKWTHVEVTGVVEQVKDEEDGDLHVVVVPALHRRPFFVAECIRQIPCPRPKKGQRVLLRGISRRDGTHGWMEIHPVETLLVQK